MISNEATILVTDDGQIEARRMTPDDAPMLALAIANDQGNAATKQYLATGDEYENPAFVAAKIKESIADGERLYGIWLTTEEGRQLVGTYDVYSQHGSDASGIFETAIWLSGQWRGRSCAARAAALVTRHMFDTVGANTLMARIDKTNAPSQRLALRLGRLLVPAAADDTDYLTFEITRDRYEEVRPQLDALCS